MDIGKPIIAVSLNYRLAGWGFLSSEEIQADGASNIGLFDQRLALRWISENIHAFGGDPEQVTIAGESAGAFSVGYHLVGFGGDHGGLFRGAILQSGSALGPTRKLMILYYLQKMYWLTLPSQYIRAGCGSIPANLRERNRDRGLHNPSGLVRLSSQSALWPSFRCSSTFPAHSNCRRRISAATTIQIFQRRQGSECSYFSWLKY